MHLNVPIQQPRQLSHNICGQFARPISDQACAIHLIAGLQEARLLRLPRFQVVQQARSHSCVRVHASGSSESSPAAASSLLKLSIPFATEFGHSVAVTTSASNWSVEEAVPLKWSEGDVWEGNLPALSGPLEYKYILKRGAEVSEWQPGDNLVVEVPEEPAVVYIQDRRLNEERSVQVQSSGLQASQQPSSSAEQPQPTAADRAAQATAAAAANSPAAAAQQPTAAEPESEDADVAAQRGNSLGKPLAKHTVKELKDLLKAAELPVTGNKAELIDRLIEAGY